MGHVSMPQNPSGYDGAGSVLYRCLLSAERLQDFVSHRVVALELNLDFRLQFRYPRRLQDDSLAQCDDGGRGQLFAFGKEPLLCLQ